MDTVDWTYPNCRGVPMALYHLARVAVDLKFHSLRKIVNSLPRANSIADLDRTNDALSIAAGFRQTEIFVTSHHKCLPRSIALMRALLRRGHRPNLIFGVTLNHFGAHCWVQLKGIVLNDSVDNVRGFTPILVV